MKQQEREYMILKCSLDNIPTNFFTPQKLIIVGNAASEPHQKNDK
jgi:hypothetical protein